MQRRAPRAVAAAIALCLVFAGGGCGDDGNGSNDDEHHGPPHTLLRIGSTALAGGKLAPSEVPVAFVEAAACLGGSGDDCDGGVVLYSGSSPGFNDLDADDPVQPLYVLPEGIDVFVEITAIDPGASLLISGELLDEAGEMAFVNESGHLHNHPAWQMSAAAGEHPEDKEIRLRLHADGFDPSDEITVVVRHFEEDDHGDSHAH